MEKSKVQEKGEQYLEKINSEIKYQWFSFGIIYGITKGSELFEKFEKMIEESEMSMEYYKALSFFKDRLLISKFSD